MNVNSIPFPVVGDLWELSSGEHAGDVVRITRITPNNVQYTNLGGGAASKSRNGKFSLRIPEFLKRYSPRSVKHVDDLPKLTQAVVSERRESQRRLFGPTHGKPTLTPDQAREVYMLAWAGTPAKEIAAAYNIASNTVSDIKHRKTYAEATAGLNIVPTTTEEPQMPPAHKTITEAVEQEVTLRREPQPTSPHQCDAANVVECHDRLIRDLVSIIDVLIPRVQEPDTRFLRIDWHSINDVLEAARNV